jgi:sulfide:quinone oxidoreductase
MRSHRHRVLIAGGGVAALEALLGLSEIAGDRVEIELLSPRDTYVDRPLAVAEPFGLGEAQSFDVSAIAADRGAHLRVDGLEAIDPAARRVVTHGGAELGYDALLVAVGARAGVALEEAITIKGPAYTGRFRTLLGQLDEHRIRRIAFAVPPGATWPLPLYELALMTAAHVRERGLRKVELRLVTPETRPLELFGAKASASVAALLEERGVRLLTGHYPVGVVDQELRLVPNDAGPVPAERVVSLPRLLGSRIPGIPHDADGFIPVDLHCAVQGEDAIYAAGDATTFPVKQGGIASQMADAAVEAIAARFGAPVRPRPFEPVLRGLLLTGGAPRYMRAEVGGGHGEDWSVSEHALWWPPTKIAGKYLSPYLALHSRDAPPGEGIPIDVPLGATGTGAIRRHAVIAPAASGRLPSYP